MSNKLNDLELSLQSKAVKVLSKMKQDKVLLDLGVEDISINETRRGLSVQMAYFARGRMNTEDVKKMYRAAGLYNITDEEAQIKNTWTLDSKHIQGKAIDLVPIKNKKIWWNAPKEVWQRMGAIGESEGLKWGGRWKKTPDTPHFEI